MIDRSKIRRVIWRMKDKGKINNAGCKSHTQLHAFLARLYQLKKPKHVDVRKFEKGRIEAITSATLEALRLLYSGYEVKLQCYHADGVMLIWYEKGETKEYLYRC